MPGTLLDEADVAALNARRAMAARTQACHAPQNALFFGLRGQVFACCFAKTHPAGTWPQQSIREIWDGVRLRRQREAVAAWDLSGGCRPCHTLVRSRNLSNLPLLNYDDLARDAPALPLRMDFELFNTCSLECIMCRGEFSSAIRRNREQLPPIPSPYDATFFAELDEFLPTLRRAHFLGGEPFLVAEYADLWERMASVNPSLAVSVQTSGAVLDRRMREALTGLRMSVSVSIDSIDPVTYESIRKNARFDRVLEHVGWFREYTRQRGTSLTMSYCPMPQNWRELPDVVAFANRWQMPLFFNAVEMPAECSLQALPAEELAEVAEVLGRYQPESGNPLERQNGQALLDLIGQIRGWAAAAAGKAARGIAAPPADIEEYLARVRRSLADAGSGDDVETTAREIEDRLRWVLAQAALRGRGVAAESRLVAIPPEIVCRSLPGLEREEALRLFEAFVMPLD